MNGEDFTIDLLFYHLKLRCFIVIDLKMQKFKPEFAGKMNFYLSAANDLLRHPDDQPSIGIILCKTKSTTVAEYALRDTHKPIGISEYRTTAAFPESFKGSLPTTEDLEAELQKPEKPPSSREMNRCGRRPASGAGVLQDSASLGHEYATALRVSLHFLTQNRTARA